MRILMLSNLYPPYFIGGYELACEQLGSELQRRDHTVHVLASVYGVGRSTRQGNVQRELHYLIDPYMPRRHVLYKELANHRCFRRTCRSFRPDIIFAWNLANTTPSLTHAARKLQIPVCYYVFDQWFSRWNEDHWFTMRHSSRSVDRILKAVGTVSGLPTSDDIPDIDNAIFASSYLKRAAIEAGLPVERNPVVRWGIDVDRYTARHAEHATPLRLLYVGQIVRHKGVHTAIEAMSILLEERGMKDRLVLTIAGDLSQSPDYAAELQDMVRTNGIGHAVTFLGKVAHDALPTLYAGQDILIFPTIWEEPYGMVQLEAMASGLAVVSSGTGGSTELVRDGVTGLLFTREDPASCAVQIRRLAENRDLVRHMGAQGRKAAEDSFQFSRMTDTIEVLLHAAADRRRLVPAPAHDDHVMK